MLISGAMRVLDNPITRAKLTFPNPFDEQEFHAFIEKSPYILVPRAFLEPDVYELDVVDREASITLAEGYKLRDYQEQAVTEIYEYLKPREYGELLFTAACGAGKSFSLAGLLARMNKSTLILSHLTILNTQILNELSVNLSGTSIGIITSKTTVFPDIAIASYQALASSSSLLNICADRYSIVCLDEGENVVTVSRLRVLFHLKHKYLIFMTATPTKELVKLTKAVTYIYGDKVVTMSQPEDSKVHSNHLMVDYRNLSWYSPDNKNMYKTSLGRFILHSKILLDMVELANSFNDIPGCVWIVADLGTIKTKLKELLEAKGVTTRIIDSSTNAKSRAEILLGISNGSIKCVIGSKPLSAGLSVKELLIGIRLIPSSSSEEELRQSTGRLNRYCSFKDTYAPLWVDFVCSGSLEYGAKSRYKLYKQSTLGAYFCKPADLISTAFNLVVKS